MSISREASVRSAKTLIRDGTTRARADGNGQEAERNQCIRNLFLHGAESYSLRAAAQLIGVSIRTLQREAEEDQREAYRLNGTWCFSWRQVAFIAMRRWTLAEIHEALGDLADTVLPPLLSLQTFTVRLPAHLVRAMEIAAAQDSVTLDEWLRLELVDFAGTVVDEMETIIPGFRRAYLFPGKS
jgi:predicted HicB family RNase H-like nuclease